MADISLEWIEIADPRMADVDELRHIALFEPFGIPRVDKWNDDIPGATHLVAIVDGRISGYACLILQGGTGQVRQVCVDPALRGSGIGTALMIEVVARARLLELESIWLNARCTAEEFYERLGWNTTSGRFPFGRTGLPHVRMEYPLD